jgi:hypothetical protein
MAIGANEIALCYLGSDALSASPLSDHVAHLANLVASWPVVPMHRRVMEGKTAVGADLAGVHFAGPG